MVSKCIHIPIQEKLKRRSKINPAMNICNQYHEGNAVTMAMQLRPLKRLRD